MFSKITRLFAPASAPRAAQRAERQRRFRPALETLEDRLTPVAAVTDLTVLTPAALVQNLVGSGITVSNISYTGAPVAAGIFTGGAASVGFDSGVVLSSGRADGVLPPNNAVVDVSNTNGTPGDADLDIAIAPDVTFDAAVLEFDFVPDTSSLSFNYVFSSDEYLEFVGSINDVFGFYLNGVNIALVPGTTLPVSINNVNDLTNSQFFVDNSTAPFPRATSMDGLTVVLNLTLPVNAGQTNHIKLVIADAVDTILDSNVFIQAGSFSSPNIKAYNPIRYAINRATGTYDGYITLTNAGTAGISGPLFVSLPNLPPGVTVANAAGVDAAGVPFVMLNAGLAPKETHRLFVQLANPGNLPLDSFYPGTNLTFSTSNPAGLMMTSVTVAATSAPPAKAAAPANPPLPASGQLTTSVTFTAPNSGDGQDLGSDGFTVYQSLTTDGYVTLFNARSTFARGQVTISFPPLPPNVTLLTLTGVGSNGGPQMVVPSVTFPPGKPVRIPFQLLNPGFFDLEGYFATNPIQVTVS